MKFGGWHRLWLLLSTLYLLVVIGVAALLWPTVENAPHRAVFYERMAGELAKELKHADAADRTQDARRLANAIQSIRHEMGAETDFAAELTRHKDNSNKVRMPNGHQIIFEVGTTEDTMRYVGRRYVDMVREELGHRRLMVVAFAGLAWVVPLAFVYLMGAGVWWVYRGFKGAT